MLNLLHYDPSGWEQDKKSWGQSLFDEGVKALRKQRTGELLGIAYDTAAAISPAMESPYLVEVLKLLQPALDPKRLTPVLTSLIQTLGKYEALKADIEAMTPEELYYLDALEYWNNG
jgi:hypothetical protein